MGGPVLFLRRLGQRETVDRTLDYVLSLLLDRLSTIYSSCVLKVTTSTSAWSLYRGNVASCAVVPVTMNTAISHMMATSPRNSVPSTPVH